MRDAKGTRSNLDTESVQVSCLFVRRELCVPCSLPAADTVQGYRLRETSEGNK